MDQVEDSLTYVMLSNFFLIAFNIHMWPDQLNQILGYQLKIPFFRLLTWATYLAYLSTNLKSNHLAFKFDVMRLGLCLIIS